MLEKQQLNYDDDDDSEPDNNGGPGSSLQLEMKQDGDQGDGWSRWKPCETG